MNLKQITSESVLGLIVRFAGLGLTYFAAILAANHLGAGDFGTYSSILSLSPIWAVLAIGGTGILATKSIAITTNNPGGIAKEVALVNAIGLIGTLFILLIVSMMLLVSIGAGVQQSKCDILLYSMIIFPIFLLMTIREHVALPLVGWANALFPHQIVMPVAFSILVFIGVHSGQMVSLRFTIISYVISTSMALVVGVIMIWKRANLSHALVVRLSWSAIREKLSSSRFFLMAALCELIMVNAVTVLISFLLGMKEAGIYFAASRLASLPYIPLGVVDRVVMPPAARFHVTGERSKLLQIARFGSSLSFTIGVGISVFIALFHKEFLGFFGKEFETGSTVLLILLAGHTANVFFGPNAALMLVTGLEKYYSRTYLVCCIILPLSIVVSAYFNSLSAVAVAVSTVTVGWNIVLTWFLWKKRKLIALPYTPGTLMSNLSELLNILRKSMSADRKI